MARQRAQRRRAACGGVVGIARAPARGRRSRQGEEGAGLVERRAKRRRARAVADDVEQVAVLPRRGVGELPRRAGRAKADVERAPAGAVEVARDPVAALAPAVRQVLPAHGLGAKAERGGDGGRVHGAAPAGAKHEWGMAGLLRPWTGRPDTGQARLLPAPEGERAVRSTAARPGRERARSAAQGARVRKVAETRVAGSRALVPRSMPCIHRWRASPASTRTERRGSTATSSPGSAPAA